MTSQRDKDREKTSVCVRQVANWSDVRATHKFDKYTFQPQTVRHDMPIASPKMTALFLKIQELDALDLKHYQTTFKHIIYSDVKAMGYGAKILASGFSAMGYEPLYDERMAPPQIQNLSKKSNRFALLSSSKLYDKEFTVGLRRGILNLFNARPANVQGHYARFLILDSGFKEGIDVFDVKYVHIFEPQLTFSDEKQVVGRGTRFCGQKGLQFHPQRGWPLYVFRYELSIPNEKQESYRATHLFPLFLQYSGIDIRKIVFANVLEAMCINGAVDRPLTKAIHSFTLEEDDDFEIFYKIFNKDKDKDKDDGPVPMEIDGGGKGKKQKPHEKPPLAKPLAKLHPKPPAKQYSYAMLRKYVMERFSAYKWPRVEMRNLCDAQKAGAPSFVDLTPTQNFVRLYFQPTSIHKGLLMWHSVGTGKTCSAIAVATSSFEREGYSILWVTRHTLKPDIWKNMFHQVCSQVLKAEWKKGDHWKEPVQAPMKILSDRWLPILSYKQFTNLLLKRNQLYGKLAERNGKEDPLRKTLVIIDEAHKLFSRDLPEQERPNINILKKMIHHSYEVSGKDSVRLLCMTATPYTSEPMDLVRLLNLMKPASQNYPETFDDFAKVYLDDRGKFTKRTTLSFLNSIAGTISYLNREKDARQFAYPVFENIDVPMSLDRGQQLQEQLQNIDANINKTTHEALEQNGAKKEIKQRIRNLIANHVATDCQTAKPKKPCLDRIRKHFRDEEQTLLAELEGHVHEHEAKLQGLKGQKAAVQQQTKQHERLDLSQERALLKKCHIPKNA